MNKMTFCETPNYSRNYGENCAETEDAAFEDVVNVSEVNDQLSEDEKIAEPQEPRIIGIIPDLRDPSETTAAKVTTTKKVLKQTTFFAGSRDHVPCQRKLCNGRPSGGRNPKQRFN